MSPSVSSILAPMSFARRSGFLLPGLLAAALPAFAGGAGGDAPLPAGANPTCPVKTGEKVDPSVSAEHAGRKIFFCCEKCLAAFGKDPAKYLANIPATTAEPEKRGSGESAVPANSAPWIWRFFGRLHPMTVHFPIALLLIAVLAETVRLLRRRFVPVSPGCAGPSDTALTCLWFGAIAAATAAAMGWANAETGTQTGLVLERHRWFGVGTAGLALATALLAAGARALPSRRTVGRLYLLLLVLTAGAVSGAGHLGGVLVYGDDYLTSAMPAWMKFWEPKASPMVAAAAPAGHVDFVKDIQPLFKESCWSCHGPEKQKGELRLDAKHLAIRSGKSAKSILPKDGEHSTMVRRLLGLDNEKRMPQGAEPWSADKIAKVKAWIDQGAEWPDAASVADAKIHRHWAYVKAERPGVPSSKFQVPSRTVSPIDAFLLARLEKEGLEPSPEASKETLIRRLSLDLTGLPPTPEETDAFVADAAPDAYEKLVDRLLVSPRYGERWARPWLDAASNCRRIGSISRWIARRFSSCSGVGRSSPGSSEPSKKARNE